MKCKLVVFVFYFLGSLYCVAQEKFDYQWVVGYPSGKIDSLFSPYLMDFSDDTVKMIQIPNASLYTILSTASICNKSGTLKLYSNGCQIHNGNFELVEGCENINPGIVWDDYCIDPVYAYYPTIQSQIILQIPEHENKYIYLAHKRDYSGKYIDWDKYDYNTEFFYTNTIDMSLNNGKGKSIENGYIIYPEVVKGCNLAACKHSNGIDWWIINLSFDSEMFYRVLLTKDGISGPWEQNGAPKRDSTSNLAQSVFSPDGKKFACIFTSSGEVWLMDFDRKTGLLSNFNVFNYLTYKDPNKNPAWDIRGVSFSPNNRFLYISAGYYMYQFDIFDSDIQNSRILIGMNDGYSYPGWPFSIVFGIQQLAHDGKIYVGQFSGSVRQWSVVNKPNEKGLDCDFKQHSFLFPSFSLPCPPIQPNFNLGPDTTSALNSIPLVNASMKSWYNPSSKEIKCWLQHLTTGKDNYILTVSDVTGRIVLNQNLSDTHYQEDITIDGSSLVPGVYIVNLLNSGNIMAYEKVMVY